jgi:hypothetical protein
MSNYETTNDKESSRPHPDWQLNFNYYNRFNWPEHKLQWYEGIPTCAVFATTQEQVYRWPGGQQAVNVILTTILDFHKPHEILKKETIGLAKAYGISIQEPKKHVLFGQG